MRKILFSIIAIFLLSGCSGYKPIFGQANLKFTISSYEINGDKNLGNMLYSKLYNTSLSKNNEQNIKNLNFSINVSKDKISTSKDSSGKALEYKISLSTKIEINDFASGEKILNRNFTSSSSYKIQDQYSDTIRLENQTIENLINKTFQEILLNLSKNISSQ